MIFASAVLSLMSLAAAFQAPAVPLDPIDAILEFARARGITQIYAGHNLRQTWRTRLTGSVLDRLIQAAEGMDVRVFPH